MAFFSWFLRAVHFSLSPCTTGGPVDFETAEFSHLDSGLLTSHTVVLNLLTLARQIGAMPEVGSFGDRMGVWLQHLAVWRGQKGG